MELVLILPVLMLLPAGLLTGAAVAHYLGVAYGFGLAGGLIVLGVLLLGLARLQSEEEAIGTQILALAFAAPSGLGAGLGAWLVLRGRRR